MFKTTIEWHSFAEEKPEEGAILLISALGDPYGDPPQYPVNIYRMLFWYNKEKEQLEEFRHGNLWKERLDRLHWAYLNLTEDVCLETEHAEVQNDGRQ